ncbi:glycoside hydrolase family 18 protein [Reichenbachiella sp. MALMAid0571]|uniref:glycoside hydrolase family 18 protein n=1 Tax=Reichenbachiella sp. MALMAid0571 TaxID=3143939 RepID=UPI0032DF5C0D
MSFRRFLIIIMIFLLCPMAQAQRPRVVAYLKYNSISRFDPGSLDYIDELIYKLIRPKANGELGILPTAISDIRMLNEERKEYPELKLLIGVGGAQINSEHFAALASNQSSRENFSLNLAEFCKTNNLQGADIDWEYPKSKQDQDNAVLLFQELKKVFGKRGLMLTTALNYSKEQVHLLSLLIDNIDQAHLMTYEPLHYLNLPTFKERFEHGVQNVIEAGISRDRVVFGVPFFGISGKSEKTMPYRKIVELYQPPREADLVDGFDFMGGATIRKTAQFIKDENWGGIMFWELGFDEKVDSPMSLLMEIERGFNK